MSDTDRNDPLSAFKDRFVLPKGVIYLDGNSLGPPLKVTAEILRRTVDDEWGQDLIASWNTHGWFESSKRLAALVAPIIGAQAGEVAICDSISVNLFKLIVAGIQLRPDRPVILAERSNFPTDLYIAQGAAQIAGKTIKLVDDMAKLEAAIDSQTALVMASHVNFKTGRIHDMKAITAKAHAQGALILWDLAHSAGALPVDLNHAQADLAVGCTYKYLNGGPGAPAYLFVAKRHHEQAQQPLSGWFGHEDPFAFETNYKPAQGITRFLTGTPPILAMKALEAGLELMAEVPIGQIRQKSISLSERFLAEFETKLKGHGFKLASPRNPGERGSQLSFAHVHAYEITQALIKDGVIGDFRAPDNLRFGFAPLYLDLDDMTDAVDRLVIIMNEQRWRDPRFKIRSKVT